jgi:TolB-like protein/Flp pilus assembly protein TadD
MTDDSPTQATSSGDVFVSYASHDAAIANATVEALEKHGVRCWIAPRDVRAGAQYADAIVRAISGAKAIVLVLSESAIASSHVGREVERAASKHRRIIALKIDAAPLTPALEYFLSESQWIEVKDGNMEAAYLKLIEAIREPEGTKPSGIPGTTPGSSSAKSPTAQPFIHRKNFLLGAGLAVLALILAALWAGRSWLVKRAPGGGEAPASAAIPEKSIAVLPFVDLTEKHDQEYFADGMAEEVIDLLANIPGLKVIGRTSSFQFKGKNQDLRAIGTALGASYVVEGSVRRSGERLRVTAQLINARDGTHLWSHTYDEPVSDILKVQDHIAFNLTRALQVTVGTDYQLKRPFKSPEAYDLYLRGRHAYERNDKEGFEAAAAYFQQILELDPTSVPALEWLAYTQDGSVGSGYAEPRDGWEAARRSAQRALALDPKSSLAYDVLSDVHLTYDWDWTAAERDSREALRLKPRDANAFGQLGLINTTLGRWDEAERLFKTALTLDPLNAQWYLFMSFPEIITGQVSEAENDLRKLLQISPTYVEGHYNVGRILLLEGQFQDALAEMQQESSDGARNTGFAMVYHALGRRADSDAALARVQSQDAQDYAFYIAETYAFRGESNQAFAWLERAYQQRDPVLYEIKSDPFFKTFKADPRYKAFLRKMNLPE